MPSSAVPPAPPPGRAMRDVARVFLRLGLTAFGGPAAHVAMMDAEIVERRRWVTRERFLELLGIANLLPGPSSSELALLLGYTHAGWRGLALAGACFILPAATMVGILAWAYVRFGALPDVAAVLYGLRPIVVAIVAHAMGRLGRSAVPDAAAAAIFLAACAGAASGMAPLAVMGLAALATIVRQRGRMPLLPVMAAAPPLAAATPAVSLAGLALVFLKLGAVVFGSGYVLLAFLRADLVDRLGWLTERQLVDAVAIGQITPGPLFTTATFVGYLLAGWPGAVVATVAIFAPAFALVAIMGPLAQQLRASRSFHALLDGITLGALGCMAVVTVQLAQAALVDATTVALAATALALLATTTIDATRLVVLGAAIGWAVTRAAGS